MKPTMTCHGDAMARSLLLVLLALQSAVCNELRCTSTLPQNVSELRSLVQESPHPSLSLEAQQIRLFPDLTFNCSGSIVGWSAIAPLHTEKGGRPRLSVWTPESNSNSNNQRFERGQNTSLLFPCLREVISVERGLYLYENTTEQPVEFQRGDILGLLLRNETKTSFTLYSMARESFESYYRKAASSTRTESLNSFTEDNKIPLLFLHICPREDEEDYQSCIKKYRPQTCIDSLQDEEEEGGLSQGVLVAAVAAPLGLALLAVSAVLVAVLLYVCLTRRKRVHDCMEKDGVVVTLNDGVVYEAQPYAEPIVNPSPQPSPRSLTPLPPIPTLPPPAPTYAVLDGPTPSPPPPYSLELDNSQLVGKTLKSPEYESIDLPRKAALLRQDATQTSVDSAGYAEVKEDGRDSSQLEEAETQ